MRQSDLAPAVRRQLRGLPAPHNAHYGVVPLSPPIDPVSIMPVRERYERAVAAMGEVAQIAKANPNPYLLSRILPRREAVSSSAIEGTHSTLDELLEVEETGDGSARISDDVIQVRDYALTLDALVPRAKEVGLDIFNEQLIRDLHKSVMRGDSSYKDRPGEIRSTVVWIGGRDIAYSTYNPAPPETISDTLKDSIRYLRGEDILSNSQSVITRMAISDAHFEAVHPFRDGNGRVGRLLLPLMMAADGKVPLYLSPYIASHRDRYIDALKAAQQRLDWPEMIGFISDAVVGTVNELTATRDALSELSDAWRNRRSFRAGSAGLKALDILPEYPVVTVKRLASILNVTFRAASIAMAQLVDCEILTEKTGYARNRVFVAKEALSVINRPFGAEPVLSAKDEQAPGL